MKNLIPRVVQLKDAHRYLGMNKNRFNQMVRPYLIEIPVGTRCIEFDRLDLDGWFEHYKQSCGRPPKKGTLIWQENERQDSTYVEKPGTLIKSSTETAFAKALALTTSKKRKTT